VERRTERLVLRKPRLEPTSLSELGERALGFFHLGTGLWLIYLTFAATLNIASGMNLPL